MAKRALSGTHNARFVNLDVRAAPVVTRGTTVTTSGDSKITNT
jgi:hypothetical protein